MAGEKSATWSGQILGLLFNATAVPNVAINASSSPLTTLYCALHTADPTASGVQTTSEVAYTGYARVAVARTAGAWSVGATSVTPVANIIWPNPTAVTGSTATYFSIGSAATGAGQIFYTGPISPPITLTVGLPPTLTPATTVTES